VLALLIMSPKLVNEPPKSLLLAVRRLLQPLVYVFLKFQLTYPAALQILKRVYVQVAVEQFPGEGKNPTDSRITLLTGVHRKDVREFRKLGFENLVAPPSVSMGAQVVAAWLGEPQYLDSDGNPLSLYRTKAQGEPSFEALVEVVSKQDLRARSLLDEWLSLGVCSINTDDRVVLNTQAFVPEKGFDEKAFYFGKNIHDHIATGAHNLLGYRPPQFDRSVYYNNLTPESMQELSQLIDDKAMEILKLVNKKARALQQQDSGKLGANQRFNFGLFYYQDQPPDEEKQ